MNKLRLAIILAILSVTAVSCDDEFFGPGSFKGIWKATEYDSEYNPMPFEVGIDYYPGDSSRILIGNFSNLGMNYDVVAKVSGLNLTIPYQEVDGRGGTFRISGNGRASSNIRKIDLNYDVDGEKFTAIFEK